MISTFNFASTPHILFGSGKRKGLCSQIKKFGNTVVLLTGAKSFTASPYWRELTDELDHLKIIWKHHTITDEPSPEMIDQIASEYTREDMDVVVAIGGGSVLDAGKAVAAMIGKNESIRAYLEGVGEKEPDGSTLPFIALPTTSGTGSECTKNAVISEVGEHGFKKSLRHDNYVPKVAIIDPELTLHCPANITAASGMDAFTQLLESYLSTNASPMTDALALSGLERIRDSFEVVMEDGNNLHARENIAYAAMISGITLANAGLGTVHGFASSIGGKHKIPHGVVCGTMMAPCNKFTIRKLRDIGSSDIFLQKYATVGKMFSGQGHKSQDFQIDYIQDIIDSWTERFSIPKLSMYGIQKSDLSGLAVSTSNKNNPVDFENEELSEMMESRL